MALTVDQQQSNLKHFCKICKKGFGCGRALGGHMRAHGIGDDSWNIDDDEDAASDWEEKHGGGNEQPGTKRSYALRTNPNRLKSCRVCEHGKCTSDDHMESSPVSSPMSDGDDADGDGERGCGWSKRKRSFRAKVGTLNSTCPSSEEEDLANCLMMLSNAEPLTVAATAAEQEESSASASRDEERRNPLNFITPISYCAPAVVDHKAKSTVVPKGLFECKACKKIFNSHQALGGHRASHKKVKGCFASRLDHLEDKDDDVITHEEFLPTKISHHDHHHPSNNATTLLMASSCSKRKSKVHECSICHRTFSSGQALGGHKRCHWITPNAPDSSTLARFQQFQDHMERMNQIPKFDNSEPLDLKLDLNLPAPADNPAQRDLAVEIFLQPWLGGTTTKEKDKINNTTTTTNNNNTNSPCHSPSNRELHHHETENDNNEEDKNNNNNSTVSMENVEDEADSKVKKLAKLSELKDMNIGGSSSPWLQVGIGSTTGVGAEP